MNSGKWTILIVCLTFLTLLACTTTKSPYPDAPGSGSAVTSSDGVAEIEVGEYTLTVSVVDFIPQPVSDVTVMAHLLKDYIYLFAVGNDEFYSTHKLVPYSIIDVQEDPGSMGKPAAPQSFSAEIEMTMERITRDVYSFEEEPEYQDSIPVDEWITPVIREGTLSDVYSLADSLCIDRNVIIHITNGVASQTNTSIQTISMVMDSTTITSDTVFSVLLGLEFHVFDADTLTINYFEYNDTTILPVIFISDAGLAAGGFFAQFTLTWGEVPEDLDSHLWTPTIGSSDYHIYYVNKGSISSDPYCFLDVDDVTSWGPEHVVIQQAFPGTYYYSVHHYAGEGNIPHSGAVVSLLKPDRTVEEFEPPNAVDTGVDWYWHVCTIDGTTGEVTEIGTMTMDPPVTTIAVDPMPSKAH